MSSINALVASASMTIIQSNKDEIKAQGDRVAARNDEIRAGAADANDVKSEMHEAVHSAEQETTEAENTKFFGKLFGARGRHERKAAELGARATELDGQAESIDRENNELRDDNEDELDEMKARLDGVQRAIDYVGKMNRDQPTIKL